MITVFDSSNYAQQVFLAEAYATIVGRGVLSQEEIDAGKFLSLDGYFAHIKDLISIEPKFAMIPSDESPFAIDANARTISVPSSFSKIAGVVGDNMCEIITFTIDRYFDYVDLAHASICVQWKLPGADGEEGISYIGLKDLVTTSGKIRFGWPLTSALTKQAGNITFSVRFYLTEEVENLDGEKESRFVYLFNTLPATLPIRAGLSVEGDDVIIEQGVQDLFKDFVSNSTNPSFPMPKPVSYTDNLISQDKIDENTDKLVLQAQATTAGDGWIDYKWYLKEGVTPRESANATAIEITGTENNFDVASNIYLPAKESNNWAKLPKNKQYYINVGSTEAESYKRVIYSLVDGIHTFKTVDGTTSAVEGVDTLYERWTQLTINPRQKDENGNWIETDESKLITGLYHVKAINSVGKNSFETVVADAVTTDGEAVKIQYQVEAINATPPLMSNECYVPTPAIVNITKNLPVDTFIDPVNDGLLTVLAEEDCGKPQRTYVWYKYNEADVEEVETDAGRNWAVKTDAVPEEVARGVDMINYITDEPGWYFVKIISLLNRDTEEVNSSLSRVVNHPTKPEITRLSYAKWSDADIEAEEIIGTTDNPLYIAAIDEDTPAEKDEDGIDNAKYGDIFQLRVTIKEGLDSKLTTDGVTYNWYMLKPEDKKPTLIEPFMMDRNSEIYQINDVNSNVLNVRCKFDADDVKSAVAYYCEITNTLANESVTLGRDDYKDMVMFLVH